MRAVSSAAALASQRPRPIVIIMQPTWRTECSVKLAAVNMTRDRVLFPTQPEEKDGVILFILIICIPTLVSYIFASRRENLCLFLRNVTWCFAFHKSKMAALSQVKYSSYKGVGSGRGTHRYGRVKRMILNANLVATKWMTFRRGFSQVWWKLDRKNVAERMACFCLLLIRQVNC